MIQRMIDVRVDHDESQRQLAAAIGYHQVQIARYETGQNTPPIAYLVKFCHLSGSGKLFLCAVQSHA